MKPKFPRSFLVRYNGYYKSFLIKNIPINSLKDLKYFICPELFIPLESLDKVKIFYFKKDSEFYDNEIKKSKEMNDENFSLIFNKYNKFRVESQFDYYLKEKNNAVHSLIKEAIEQSHESFVKGINKSIQIPETICEKDKELIISSIVDCSNINEQGNSFNLENNSNNVINTNNSNSPYQNNNSDESGFTNELIDYGKEKDNNKMDNEENKENNHQEKGEVIDININPKSSDSLKSSTDSKE